jgi:hypothetical protein
MRALSQTEGDEIFEILVRACDATGPHDTPSLLARISVLLGREVGANTLQTIVDKALDTAPNNTNTGQRT